MNETYHILWGLGDGTLICQDSLFTFKVESVNGTLDCTVSAHELTLLLTGKNKPIVQVEHSQFQGTPILVSDIKILARLKQLRHRQADTLFMEIQKKHRKLLFLRSLPVLLILALFVGLPMMLYFAPVTLINQLVSLENEMKVRSAIENRLSSNRAPTSREQKLTDLAQRLKTQSKDLAPFSIVVVIANTSEVNAFALPGGLIIVNQGLLNQADTLDEVLGVLGHELGHVALRHTTKALINGVGLTSGYLVLSLIVGLDFSQTLLSGASFLGLSYTRAQELEADAFSAELLSKNGVPLTGIESFFEKMKRLEKVDPTNHLSIFRTHPANQERIDKFHELQKNESIHGSKWATSITLNDLKDH